jgi:hypothetical protein
MLVSDIQLGLPDGELLSCVTQAMDDFGNSVPHYLIIWPDFFVPNLARLSDACIVLR